MSILNVNTIQPIGSGTTVTVAATELKTSNFITVGTGASVTSPSANVLTLGTNTAERLRIDSAGNIGIGTVSPSGSIHAHAASGTQRSYLEASAAHSFLRLKSGSTSYNSGIEFFSGASNIANINGLGGGGLQFEVNGSERLRITSGGDLFVAGTGGMNTTQLPNGSTINVNGTSSNDGLSVIRYSTGYGAYGLNIGRSKSDTIGTNAAVTNGNDLGHITFYGADGTDFNQAAMITAQVDGTPSDGTDMPGRLVFKTSSDASATPTERLRITSSGQLNLAGNMQFTGGTPELEFNNGGPRFRVPAANTLTIHTGGGLGATSYERLRITSAGHVLPGANNTYDLGSTANGWRNVYMNDLNLSNMNGDTNDVDGTQGSWTIQEGKDDLYIINRLNGKKFKIKMEEIS